jgi:competence protein ComEC
LYAELLLPFFVSLPSFAYFFGNIISFLVKQMDGYIERTASLPFAVTSNINISFFQTAILYLLIVALAWWLLQKNNRGLLMGAILLVLFVAPSSLREIRTKQQQKLVVYNVPGQTVIDVIEGSICRLVGNDTVINGSSKNFILAPARLQYGAVPGTNFKRTLVSGRLIAGTNKRVLIINQWNPAAKTAKIAVDIVILCAGANTSPARLSEHLICSQYVFDGSASLWKIQQWKKEAESLHLRHHSTPEQGAFELAL